MLGFPQPHYLPCAECGHSVARGQEPHVCDRERPLDYVVFQLRDEIAEFDRQLSTWLASPAGRFAVWLAVRDRG